MYGFEALSESTKAVMQLAEEEAGRRAASYLCTEHVLLGLLRDQGCLGATILENLGVSVEAARDKVDSIAGDRHPRVRP